MIVIWTCSISINLIASLFIAYNIGWSNGFRKSQKMELDHQAVMDAKFPRFRP